MSWSKLIASLVREECLMLGALFFPRGDEGETVATRRVGGRTRTRAPDLGTLEESETGSKRSRFFYGVEEGAGIREEGVGGG